MMEKLIENFHKLTPEKQNLLKILLKEKGIDLNTKFILPLDRKDKVFPMSYAQQRLWFLEQLDPHNLTYIIPICVKILGVFNIDTFIRTINKVVERHEILRTKFVEINGEGFQEIVDHLEIIPNLIELNNKSDNELNEIILQEISEPFILDKAPLFRVTIINVTENIYYLLIPMHHIISDNWSTGILIKEIIQIYNSLLHKSVENLPNLPIQYADFSVWQKELLKSKELLIQKQYWINKLKNSNYVLEIIPDKKRPTFQTNNGTFELFTVDSVLSSDIISFCKREDITQFVFLISVFNYLLARYSNQDDLNIGVPIANRNRIEIENLIGFFINTLVFRNKVNYDISVLEYLKSNKKNSFEAYSNQDIPFEMIINELNLERDMSHTALFQSMFVLNNAPMPELNFGEFKIEPFEIDLGRTKFDLVLSLTFINSEFKGKFEYNTDIYKKDTILNLIENFIYLIKEFIFKKDKLLKDIYLLDHSTKITFQNKLKYASIKFDKDLLLHKLFEEQAKLFKDKTAITDESTSITFYHLNTSANKIANLLIQKGLKIEERVGIFIDRKIEYIISIVGVLKAGGTFVPIDINYPHDRIKYIVEDSNIRYILTQKEFLFEQNIFKEIIIIDDVIDNSSEYNNPQRLVLSDNLAYVIYTSGSTGEPKGVMVEHNQISNHIKQMIIDFGIKESDKYLQFASFNFDASIEQIFVPLLKGAEIYLRNNSYWTPSEFINLLKEQFITVINPPTVYWNQILIELKERNINSLLQVRLVIVGGEEMKVDFLKTWKDLICPDTKLINAYGPTETIITSAMLKTEEVNVDNNGLHTPIGKCLGDREVYILDKFGVPVPPSMLGELYFGGEILSRGYQSNPVLTAEKFLPNPFSNKFGSRMYKTGDIARYNSNGFIEYLGRIDNQIKLRGFRIELGEIDQVLLKNDNVSNVITILNSLNENNISIASFVLPKQNEENLSEHLLNYCKKNLPSYMVPSDIIIVDTFPINASGKIDKKSLLSLLTNKDFISKVEYVPPRTDLEETITNIVIELLNINKVGVYDNFFELGGHSILAIKLISKIRSIFGIELELKKIFENPTIEGIAESIISEQANLIDDNELENLLNDLNEG